MHYFLRIWIYAKRGTYRLPLLFFLINVFVIVSDSVAGIAFGNPG